MGFVLAAVIGSTMSSLGSEFNTLSGILTRDFYMKKIKPGLAERDQIYWGRVFTALIGAVTVAMAVVFNELQGLNLMDIMFRVFSAFAPAIMIPLIAGLFIKKLNARGALTGMICGAVTGIVLVVANLVLVQAHAAGMKLHPQLDYWLRSGWNSAATVLSVAATIAGMWLGSASRAARKEEADEKRRSGEFFSDLARPFLRRGTGRQAIGPVGPFRTIGLILLAYGLAMAAVAVFIRLHDQNVRAFGIDLVVAGVLIALGSLMQLTKKKAFPGDPGGMIPGTLTIISVFGVRKFRDMTRASECTRDAPTTREIPGHDRILRNSDRVLGISEPAYPRGIKVSVP